MTKYNVLYLSGLDKTFESIGVNADDPKEAVRKALEKIKKEKDNIAADDVVIPIADQNTNLFHLDLVTPTQETVQYGERGISFHKSEEWKSMIFR